MRLFVTIFTKITGAIPMWFKFRPKVYYVNKKSQSRRIKGSALVISNHTSVYDFALMLLLFPFRNLRYLMGELLFKKPRLSWFLKNLGGIKVNRDLKDMSFLKTALDILKRKGVVGSFPEARLHDADKDIEGELLPFVPSTASIALKSGAPIIPVYFEKSKGFFKNKVIIGEKIFLRDICTDTDPSVTKLKELSALLRDKIIELKDTLHLITDKDKRGKILDAKRRDGKKVKKEKKV